MISIRTSTTRARLSRRLFLRGVGASAAFVPLLSAERAVGAGAAPKRIVTIAWGNGVPQSAFWPAGDDPTASPVLSALASLKSKVLIPGGVDLKIMLEQGKKHDGHFSYPTLFTGTYRNLGGQQATATGPSIDQVVADFNAKQVNLPLPVMAIVTGGRSTSHAKDGTRNTAESDPVRLYTRVFAGQSLPADQVNALKDRRKSVLDHLRKELDAFAGRLGTEDRAKVGAHTEAIRQLELQLSVAPKGCTAGSAPAGGDYATRVKSFMSLTALALRCDLTRAVSITWSADGGSDPNSLPHVGVNDYHGLAHRGSGGYGTKIKVDSWYYEQVASLARALDETPELGGTALDNTIIITGNDMNEGALHYVGQIPFVIIGSGGGALRTGRMLRMGTWAGKTGTYWRGDGGVPHNKLLATVANALGVPGESFGTGYAGTLPELKA